MMMFAIAIAELRAAEGGGSLRGTLQQPIRRPRFRPGGQSTLLKVIRILIIVTIYIYTS